jgi:protein-S-isoprenylcysteine O-methyltransferase Ste14
MGLKNYITIGKILYAFLFVLVLPGLLILWANRTESIVSLPKVHYPIIGMGLILVGCFMIITGTINLYTFGKGFPMSPYPPTQYVSGGIFHYVPHPIYSGACILLIGISLYFGSTSGLWLISPIFILACVAFVIGFEKEDLRKRFPKVEFKPLISLPLVSEQAPTAWSKLSAYLLVLIPMFSMLKLVSLLTEQSNSHISYLPFESKIPIIGFSILFYILIYPLVLFAPLFAKTKKILRNFMISGIVASAFGFFVMIIIPLITPTKPIESSNVWNKLVNISFTITPLAKFPSFHVIWTWIALSIYVHRNSRLKLLWRLIAVLISISCITSGNYSLLDIAGGFAIYWLTNYRVVVWRLIQRSGERIANSWKEWDFGYIRVMNHGLYGGLATFVGILMAGTLIGARHLPALLIVTVTTMIVAALWAQFIEGSKKLLRPLGFYGGILGVIIGCLLVTLILHEDFFLIWAPLAVAAPWIQGIGRLRCLVQGCCHGSVTDPNIGIRYFHQRSRVVRLANLKGEYLHPTPIYSILANIVGGIFLLKLWFISASLPLIIGFSFILNGLSRFVEESYRGEPQTPILKGLRLYQWLAIFSVIFGAMMTTYPYNVEHSWAHFSLITLLIAILGAILAMFLTGVDFPHSNKRFSRLV